VLICDLFQVKLATNAAAERASKTSHSAAICQSSADFKAGNTYTLEMTTSTNEMIAITASTIRTRHIRRFMRPPVPVGFTSFIVTLPCLTHSTVTLRPYFIRCPPHNCAPTEFPRLEVCRQQAARC